MKSYSFYSLFFLILFTSCSIDDDIPQVITEVMPIESVDVPEHFIFGQTHEISVTYSRPSSCYQFYDFIYAIDGNTRTVAVVNTLYANENCTQEPESATASFELTVTRTETYVFKFFQGQNEDGVDQYHLVEVPVVLD